MAELTKEPTLAEVLAEMAAMRGTMAEQNEIILDLKGKQAKSLLDEQKEEVLTIPTETVKRGDKEYAWQRAIFTIGDKRNVKAEEAALSDDIIDEILTVPGQGILKELA